MGEAFRAVLWRWCGQWSSVSSNFYNLAAAEPELVQAKQSRHVTSPCLNASHLLDIVTATCCCCVVHVLFVHGDRCGHHAWPTIRGLWSLQ